MKIDEIKKELSNGDVMSAMPELRDLVAKEPDNQEAKVLYGTCCHICSDNETFVRIDDELAKDRNFCHKRKYRKYHAMRVAACGAVAVAMTAAVLPAPVDAATREVRGASTLYGAFYDDCETDTIRIYFNNGGGSGSMSTVTRKVDYCSYSIYTLPACRFTRSGYTFAGWEVSNPCMYTSSLFQPGEDFELSPGCGDFHLTARWSQAAQRYSLTVDPNGGYLSGGNFGSDNGESWSTSVTVTRGGARRIIRLDGRPAPAIRSPAGGRRRTAERACSTRTGTASSGTTGTLRSNGYTRGTLRSMRSGGRTSSSTR